MDAELLAKLREHIARSHRYPPLIVRERDDGTYEIIDGRHRKDVLGDLGLTTATCVVWEADDEEVLLLLATLNRLHGEDVPGRRAALLLQLSATTSAAELARLLPDTEADISAALAATSFDVDAFVDELEGRAAAVRAAAPRLFSFAVPPEDVAAVERALEAAAAQLVGANRNGRSLVVLARHYLEPADGSART
jgi:ParB-like chromosome segregation protein Spo0J